MLSFGIMQGRLTPSRGRGIQFFPFDNWEKEFYIAQEIGVDEIEWIFDYENYQENPLWTLEGRNRLKAVIKDTGVKVNSICFDYFMRRPHYKAEQDEKAILLKENVYILEKILKYGQEIEAKIVEIPLVDNSSIKSEEEENKIIDFILKMSEKAEEYGMILTLETDFPPVIFRKFLEKIGKENVKANYDSGNSSGLGYDAEQELNSLNEYVYNVHIKDREFGGTTVKLGTGSADFTKVFGTLKKIGYKRSFVLQAARGVEGEEMQNIKQQLEFIKQKIEKYEIKY